jgi:hypothetical protein
LQYEVGQQANPEDITMTSVHIPALYRVWFTTVDAVLSITGAVGHFFTPELALKSFSVSPTIPPTVETRALLDTLSGVFTGIAFTQSVLLRARPDDLTVWRTMQFGILLIDVAMLYGTARALSAEDRLNLLLWRTEDWFNIGVTAWVAALRTAFCLGIGVKESTGASTKNKES